MSETVSTKTSGAATASLVCGILGCLGFGMLTGIPAVICGHVALSRIRASRGTLMGRGLAMAGLICGYVSTVATVAVVALLLPAVSNATLRARSTGFANNGRMILQSVRMADNDNIYTSSRATLYPSSPRYGSSTEYFRMLVASNVMSVSHSFFAAPGTPRTPGGDGEFKAENNAWCVVADLAAESPENTPFLLSRNIRAQNLTDLKGRIADTLTDDPPFGKRAAVFVTAGGAAYSICGASLNQKWSDFLGEQAMTNRILRP